MVMEAAEAAGIKAPLNLCGVGRGVFRKMFWGCLCSLLAVEDVEKLQKVREKAEELTPEKQKAL